MVPQADGSFVLNTQRFSFKLDTAGNPVSFEGNLNGDLRTFTLQKEWQPTAEELNTIAGVWYSEEADATFKIVVENGQAFLTQRPATRLQLRPQFKDNFIVESPGTIMWFTRDPAGKLTAHAGTARLRDIVFTRVQ